MASYDVGYKKPPVHSRFQAGNRANPLGRGARQQLHMDEIVSRVLNATEIVLEKNKKKQISRIQRTIRKYGNAALKGDVEAAAFLLELWQHFKASSDITPEETHITVTLPPLPKW